MRARDVMRRKRFRKWLQKKFAEGPRTIVGQPADDEHCPLATYARDNGLPSARVGWLWWWPSGDSSYLLTLTPWVRNFVDRVDSTKLKNITAQKAIELLEAA